MMNITVSDKIDQDSYDRIVELLVDYNLSKTQHLENEINKPIEKIGTETNFPKGFEKYYYRKKL